MSKIKLYDILKINIKDILDAKSDLYIRKEEEYKYLIRQQESLLFDQIRLVRGYDTKRINELIFVVAKHNKKRKPLLEKILREGFKYNNVQYIRFGKSNSQAKQGVTVFIEKDFYEEIIERSKLGIEVDKCVISKYESYRSLIFSACRLVNEKLPNIVLVDEYTKTLPRQHVRYAVEKDIEYIDKNTGEKKIYKNQRVIEEGYHDIKISPFDGFGCHTEKITQMFAKYCGKEKYIPISYQIRLPFLKGISIQAPIKEFYEERGITEIKDVFGKIHKVKDIDCLWNVSMWKAYDIFKDKFGNNAWNEYIRRINKYNYKLGISKYSHHTDDINLYTRANFQYLQCLDLINPKYVKQFKERNNKYNILDTKNYGKIIKVASYSTSLIGRIINGDKFTVLKFLGINDTEEDSINSKYIDAVLINDIMLKDPCIRNTLRRKLQKIITQMKLGKIYVEGFYHTAVGDIVGYLEYAAGEDVKGCLNGGEFYCDTIPLGDCLSFRSPLVDPSEVNKVKIIHNDTTKKYFSHFKNQDVCMVNMYDLTMPQQGGCDFDGDSLLLCHNPILLKSKIDKPIVVDVDDKKSSLAVEYNQDNIVYYEHNSRDDRIGEITNVATSIINQYTEDEYWQKVNADKISLLRLYQGKEIDFLKVGYRWVLNKSLRKHLKKLPYFLLYNYPQKLNVYNQIRNINKGNKNGDKIPYNAYYSPSPLNELCNFIIQWEKRKIIWNNDVINTGYLLVDDTIDVSNKHIIKKIRLIYDDFKRDFQKYLKNKSEDDNINQLDILFDEYKKRIFEIKLNYKEIANYCISVAYRNISETKTLCWAIFGDVILENLRKNSLQQKQYIITNANKKEGQYEFLGKYYNFTEV